MYVLFDKSDLIVCNNCLAKKYNYTQISRRFVGGLYQSATSNMTSVEQLSLFKFLNWITCKSLKYVDSKFVFTMVKMIEILT